MSPALKHNTAMGSTPLPIARPWTPPELDTDDNPHSDYFSDPFGAESTSSNDLEDLSPLFPPSPAPPSTRPKMSARRDSHVPQSRPQAITTMAAPYTPTKASGYGNPGAPQYPYTPDSAHTNHTCPLPGLSPTPPMPWDNPAAHTSPVQNALFSCLSHLEHLISTSQPNDDQMEYIVAQFEAIASYLSAPEAQSRRSDDHLFSELESTSVGAASSRAQEIYVAEVDKYIEDVRHYTGDLRSRMDEVKQLNSIQLEIINDLRRELRTRAKALKNAPQRRRSVVLVKPWEVFWGALGEALDSVGNVVFEQ